MQNPGLFKTLRYSEQDSYSEPCQTSTMERLEKHLTAIIFFASNDYFRNITFSCPLVYEIDIMFLM